MKRFLEDRFDLSRLHAVDIALERRAECRIVTVGGSLVSRVGPAMGRTGLATADNFAPTAWRGRLVLRVEVVIRHLLSGLEP